MNRFVNCFLLALIALCKAAELHSEVPDQIYSPGALQNPMNNLQYHVIQPPPAPLPISFDKLLLADSKLQLFDKLSWSEKIALKIKKIAPKVIKQLIKVTAKIGVVAVAALFLASLGIGFTAVVCNYSSLCSFKLAGYTFNAENVQETMRSYIPPEKLSSLANFVLGAIQNYSTDV